MSEAKVRSLVDTQPWDLLGPLLDRIGANRQTAIDAMRRYATELAIWNSRVSNLMSHNDMNRIVERHLVESIEPAPVLNESGCRSFVDFGSGAGFPAIPLAVVGVGEQWVLVESRRPKTLFLRKVIAELGLANVSVAHVRLEDLQLETLADGFTARATARIGPTLRLASSLIRPGGKAFLWKGSGWRDEVEADRNSTTGWQLERVIELHERPIVMAVFAKS